MFCSILIFISSVLRMTDDRTERTGKEAAVPRLKTVSPHGLTAPKGSRQNSVTVVGGYHATTSNARRLVQWLVTLFKLAHHSPSCCSTDKQQYIMCRCNSHLTNFHLKTPISSFQAMNDKCFNTLFTYTKRAFYFSSVSTNSSSLSHSC